MKHVPGLIALILAALISGAAYAYSGFDVCVFGKETLPSVICYGPTVMKQTIVTGNIRVAGSLQADNVSANNLMIDGPLNIKNSYIKGSVNVTGNFFADHVEFKQGLAIAADDIVLSNSKVNGLMTITSKENNPYLQVQCQSLITGSVLFDGKAGVVQVTGDSLVQGKVVNGSLEFVKRACE